MSKTGYITARVEPKLKESAGRVLARIGVSTSDAITMFLRQVVMRRGMPFDVAVPNARTRRAIEELETPAKRGKLRRHVRADAMFADILARQPDKKEGMRTLVASTAFRKDLRRARRRGRDLRKLDAIIARLQRGEALPVSNRDHPLKGDWKAIAIAISNRTGCSSTN